MSHKEQDHPFDKRGGASRQHDDLEEELLPTISLINVPHAKIPNLYQRCYEYVERWQWSSETELVETGRWFFEPPKESS